jgi:hypothetical protein
VVSVDATQRIQKAVREVSDGIVEAVPDGVAYKQAQNLNSIIAVTQMSFRAFSFAHRFANHIAQALIRFFSQS